MRLLIKVFSLIFLLATAAVGGAWWWANQPLSLRNSPLDFRIVAGSSLRSAIGQMQEAGARFWGGAVVRVAARLARGRLSLEVELFDGDAHRPHVR